METSKTIADLGENMNNPDKIGSQKRAIEIATNALERVCNAHKKYKIQHERQGHALNAEGFYIQPNGEVDEEGLALQIRFKTSRTRLGRLLGGSAEMQEAK